jgi:hypothetical protein
MELSIKHYGNSRITPSKIIQLTIKGSNCELTEDVTNLNGKVDKDLIDNLRQIADELEYQNQLIEGNNDSN